MNYRGRFAPSPSGGLHLGSLVAALASYLDARCHAGEWLIRIEDVDPPREVPAAADKIIESLACHGMHSDRMVSYQSQRLCRYVKWLHHLRDLGMVYACECKSKRLKVLRQQNQACACANQKLPFKWGLTAWRLRVDRQALVEVNDRHQGLLQQNIFANSGDFALVRRDGLVAYQLAVVVDDWLDGISHIVRGADLFEVTPRQIYLQQQVVAPRPDYLHVAVMVDARGYKLSKQNQAVEIDNQQALNNLHQAAEFLGLVGVKASSVKHFYQQAIPAWRELMVLC